MAMYALPPIVPETFSHMETNNIAMYKLPPIQGPSADDQDSAMSDPVAALEKRQEDILKKLNSLQIRVNDIRGGAKPDSAVEIAIQANPLHPPYSLPLALQVLGKKHSLRIHTTTHVHSSQTKPLPNKLVGFLEAGSNHANRSDADVKVALIWKDVGPDPVCTIGLLPSDCVRGEVNLLRFLGRVFNLGNYNVLNGAKSHVEEELLDQIHSQLVWGDVAVDKKSVMNQAEQIVKAKGQVNLSISDLMAYSAAKAIFTAKMPPTMTKFIQNCEKLSQG